MPDRILVPVDGSERSKEALEYALDTFPDTEIIAFHAVEVGGGDLGTFSAMTGGLPDDATEIERSDAILEAARERGRERGVEVETERGRGRPDHLIVARAEENDFDMIVIGSHGREGVARVLLGSVAEKVARRSPVPVLVVR